MDVAKEDRHGGVHLRIHHHAQYADQDESHEQAIGQNSAVIDGGLQQALGNVTFFWFGFGLRQSQENNNGSDEAEQCVTDEEQPEVTGGEDPSYQRPDDCGNVHHHAPNGKALRLPVLWQHVGHQSGLGGSSDILQ